MQVAHFVKTEHGFLGNSSIFLLLIILGLVENAVVALDAIFAIRMDIVQSVIQIGA